MEANTLRYITYSVLIIINYIFQTTLAEYITIIGVKPNTNIILIISFAFMRGEIEGALIGFFSGLLIDVFFSNFLGLNAFLGFILGFICGKFSKEFYNDSTLTPFFLTVIFTFIHGLLYFFFNVLLRGYPNILIFLKSIIIPETLYTSLFSFFLYRIYYIINSKLENFNKSNRKF